MALFGVCLGGLSACAPTGDGPWSPPSQLAPQPPQALNAESLTTSDGMRLPLHQWRPPSGTVRGIIVGVHGMNQSLNTFAEAGPWWAAQGFAVYAYDQRGFGASPTRGDWGGGPAMARDLLVVCALARRAHPGAPLVVVGESMGGAVTLVAADMAQQMAAHTLATDTAPPWADGIVLAAPAVWSRDTMPWTYRMTLAIMVRIAPDLALSGKGLGILPTDNIEMLRGLAKDPRVIKRTPVRTVYGIANLMDQAAAVASKGTLDLPILWLYGERDELIPPGATFLAARALLHPAKDQRLVVYPNGWHMLLQDLQSELVFADIAAFALNRRGPIPFGISADLKAETFAQAIPQGR